MKYKAKAVTFNPETDVKHSSNFTVEAPTDDVIVCGQCGAEIIKGISQKSAQIYFYGQDNKNVVCDCHKCGATNLLSEASARDALQD
ncbi:hypothetical protein LJR098_001089 [Rhizobium sp. LjRoot98]|uniref:hypothetical protein n=1 Tax=Rhizobium sp. LjRoot98 TaxID=3342345 RepID=UPI003ED046A8